MSVSSHSEQSPAPTLHAATSTVSPRPDTSMSPKRLARIAGVLYLLVYRSNSHLIMKDSSDTLLAWPEAPPSWSSP